MHPVKFWMVLGNGTPIFRHPTKQAAVVEAERLANMNPGHPFTVLESMATVVKSQLRWETHDEHIDDPNDDVPF